MMEEQFRINDDISIGIGCLLCDDYMWQWGNNTWYKNFLLYNPFGDTGFISLSNNTHGWSLVHDKIPTKIKKFMIDNYKNKNLFE
jgi:hypothetical protein